MEGGTKKLSGEDAQIEDVVPKIWTLVQDIDIFVDSPMHLIFQGVVLSILDVTSNTLANWQLRNSFFVRGNEILSDLMEFKLSYLQLKQCSPVQWLAADILGITRILPYVYGVIVSDALKHPGGRELLAVVHALFVMVSMLMTKIVSLIN